MGKRSQRDPSTVGSLKRGPRGEMVDWNAVFATLPEQFTLETISAHKAVSEKPRAYLRQVVVRWSKEGRIKRTGRGMYQKSCFGLSVQAKAAIEEALEASERALSEGNGR